MFGLRAWHSVAIIISSFARVLVWQNRFWRIYLCILEHPFQQRRPFSKENPVFFFRKRVGNKRLQHGDRCGREGRWREGHRVAHLDSWCLRSPITVPATYYIGARLLATSMSKNIHLRTRPFESRWICKIISSLLSAFTTPVTKKSI